MEERLVDLRLLFAQPGRYTHPDTPVSIFWTEDQYLRHQIAQSQPERAQIPSFSMNAQSGMTPPPQSRESHFVPHTAHHVDGQIMPPLSSLERLDTPLNAWTAYVPPSDIQSHTESSLQSLPPPRIQDRFYHTQQRLPHDHETTPWPLPCPHDRTVDPSLHKANIHPAPSTGTKTPVEDSGEPGPIDKLAETGAAYTPDEDLILYQWVRDCKAPGEYSNGPEMYKHLEAKHPSRTWRSWRDRYNKRLKHRPESVFKIPETAPPST